MKFLKLKKAVNLLHAYYDLLLGRDKPRAMPVELSLGTTSFCNLKCVMCPREGSDGNLTPFDEHIDMQYFVEMRPYLERAKEISLYGLGEPMIDRGYFEKVRFVNSFGAEVSLSSNGTLLDEQRCREVIQSGIKAIGISLDAACEDTFKVVRPPGGFDAIVENVKLLSKFKKEMNSSTPELHLSCGVMKQNIHDVEKFPDIAKELDAQVVVVHTIIHQSRYAERELGVTREEVKAVADKARKRAEELNLNFVYWDLDSSTFLKSVDFYKENPVELQPKTNGKKKGKPKAYCHFLWRNAMIQGKGELFPCCYLSNLKVGKVENGNLRELRNDPVLVNMRRSIFEGDAPPPCQTCPQMVPFSRKQILKNAWNELKALWRAKSSTPQ
ncbi:radical SAM protein [bacterium]|nr:radical SAM protein [bacterium]